MTKNCILPFCKNRGKVFGIIYYRITARRRESWLKAIGRSPCDKISSYSFVCSNHFRQQDFNKDGTLLDDAVPILNLRPSTIEQKSGGKSVVAATAVTTRKVLSDLNIFPSTSKQDMLDVSSSKFVNDAEDSSVNFDTGPVSLSVKVTPADETNIFPVTSNVTDVFPDVTVNNKHNVLNVDDTIPLDSDPVSSRVPVIATPIEVEGSITYFTILCFILSVIYKLICEQSSNASDHNRLSQITASLRSVIGENETNRPSASGISPLLKRQTKKRQLDEELPSSSSDSVGLMGAAKKRRRFIKQDHSYSTSTARLMKVINCSKEQKRNYQQRVRSIKQKVSRLQQKIIHLKDIVHNLKQNDVLSNNAVGVLEKTYTGIPLAVMKRMMNNLQTGKLTRQPFPEELKCFALTLQFYSSKAYNYVREVFNLALPSPSVLRNWIKNVDCAPGFCTSAFDVLKEVNMKCQTDAKTLLCSLIFDEIAIKKQIDLVGQNAWVYVDFGTGLKDDSLTCATEALVLMVTAINSYWKVPIAYFFINSLSAAEKANIITEALIRLDDIGIKIISVTCDGLSANFSMAKELGAELMDLDNIRTYFPHPVNNERVYIIYDICHLLKLLRNNWAIIGKFRDVWGDIVDFNYIRKLYELQEAEMLHLANKLKKPHIAWQRQKMKVSLAAQTISKSVADALQFLMEDIKHPEFINAGPTIKFLRLMDATFDLLNSRNIFARGSKTPLKECNQGYWSPILEEAIIYLGNVKNMEGQFLNYTRHKTPFRGFVISIKSILGLYNDHVQNGPLNYLLTYKMSQDHLELFFAQVRSRNGWNNNPTAYQFYYTFKRLLLKNNIKNLNGNCLIQDSTSLLDYKINHKVSEQIITIDDISIIKKYNINMVETINDHDYCLSQNPKLNILTENVVAYISGFVVKTVKKHIKCNECISTLEDFQGTADDSLMFYNIKNRGGLLKPSTDVINVLKKVEILIRNILHITNNKIPKEKGFINSLTTMICDQILIERKSFLYYAYQNILLICLSKHIDETSFDEENHMQRLLKKLIFIYLKIRLNAVAKKYTENIRGELIRKKLSKLILFAHQ